MADKSHRIALSPPIIAPGVTKENYPKNHWWVAALSSEVKTGELLERRILGKSIILYRTKSGQVVALQNRCAHRAAPLSLGRVEDDKVVCLYHGFAYGASGKCVHIPTQDNIPAGAAVRSYPVIENSPLVWVWTGDPLRAEESRPPEFPWMTDPNWLVVGGTMPLKANYMSLKENVLDLTHFGFVHANTFQIKDWVNPPDVNVLEDGSVCFEQRFDATILSPMYVRLTGLDADRKVDRLTRGRSLSPAIHEAVTLIKPCETSPNERTEYLGTFMHVTTPESDRATHYWWFAGTDYGLDVPEAAEWLTDFITAAFVEDKYVLEAIQKAADADPDYASGQEVSVLADKAGLQARRQLFKALEKSNQPTSETST